MLAECSGFLITGSSRIRHWGGAKPSTLSAFRPIEREPKHIEPP
jgi:hypothetical protein